MPTTKEYFRIPHPPTSQSVKESNSKMSTSKLLNFSPQSTLSSCVKNQSMEKALNANSVKTTSDPPILSRIKIRRNVMNPILLHQRANREKLHFEKAVLKKKEMEIKNRQRLEIYALNKIMAEWEQQQFLKFHEQNPSEGSKNFL